MANHPIPDQVPSLMMENGTRYLITDPRADAILAKSAKHGSERYTRWCGGKGGFDDFAERLH